MRRELQDVDLSEYIGLDIKAGKAKLSLGEKRDVNLWRFACHALHVLVLIRGLETSLSYTYTPFLVLGAETLRAA